ncbi:MAG TPA: hypothetical protein VK593_03465 [Edaphobacter sp.]|nr:hypothetical protein [Edaphobacter sp.]
MKSLVLSLLVSLALSSTLHAQSKSHWRSATATELETALPARAPVEKERIETEKRTASGIINAQGKIIAGVVLITAGYSADGKYSHYLLIQAPITLGDIALSPGNYVFGWQRSEAGLSVKFYDAATGAERGTVTARRLSTGSRVESFRLWPPSDHQFIQIGRFALPYSLGE